MRVTGWSATGLRASVFDQILTIQRPGQFFGKQWHIESIPLLAAGEKGSELPLLPEPHLHVKRPNLTELAARKFVESHGGDALAILGERADLAEERGHHLAARAWRDLADIAARLLTSSYAAKAAALAAKGAAWRASLRASLR